MLLGYGLDDGQSHAAPLAGTSPALVNLVEALEKVSQVLTGDPYAAVGNVESRPAVMSLQGQGNSALLRSVLDGIIDEVLQESLQPVGISSYGYVLLRSCRNLAEIGRAHV